MRGCAFHGDLHSISLRRAASVCHRLSCLFLALPFLTETLLFLPFAGIIPSSSFVPLFPSFTLCSPPGLSPGTGISLFLALSHAYPLCFHETFFRLFVLASSRAGNRRLAPRDSCPVKREILSWRCEKNAVYNPALRPLAGEFLPPVDPVVFAGRHRGFEFLFCLLSFFLIHRKLATCERRSPYSGVTCDVVL